MPTTPTTMPAKPTEFAKGYEPAQVEARLYGQWVERGYFTADPKSPKPAYSIVIPPPNVTGILTMGHVLNNTIQDILVRKARMEGKEVLWLPGTDHAGIATQTVVEKKVKKETGKTRQQMGRDLFLKEIWAWKEKHGGIIIEQLKSLGCSCDWGRERFTMDEGYSAWVARAFKELYDYGFIHRGERMINWCPVSLTALSDEEVIPTPQKSILYYVRYKIWKRGDTFREDDIKETSDFIEVATTRPETIMADVAIAVHPSHPLASEKMRGRLYCARPLAPNHRSAFELIPIIVDDAIDPEFGAGALKITPAHDQLDFEIAQRHASLHDKIRDILTPDGKINCPDEPALHGLDRFAARKKAAELLHERGALVREEAYENTVGFSERAHVPIEPRLSLQWFLRYPKSKEALDVVRELNIRFYPERWEKVYEHWMSNLQEWCISRQLWWGHRIPVWYKDGEAKCVVDPAEIASLEKAGWVQDEDVLDTWFSAWLWPFATMDEVVRAKFYPTSALVTGPDIIFFWVARMIMAGLHFMEGRIPFKDVYFTGIIRDRQGRKMSKSLGNSPDPLDLIAQYGADGLRFGLMRIAPQGQDIRFDAKQIEEGRNFCNKLWNACRFRLLHGAVNPKADPLQYALDLFSHAILQDLKELVETVTLAYVRYEFSAIAQALYDYVWQKFCSEFLETAKADLARAESKTRAGTLATFDFALSHILRLLHPLAPFITEELWLALGFGSKTIQFEAWPAGLDIAINAESAVLARKLYQTAEAARRLKADFNLQDKQRPRMHLALKMPYSEDELLILQALAGAEAIEILGRDASIQGAPMILTPLGELYMPLAGLVDPEKERQRLAKEIEKARADLDRERKKLQNADMLANAPAEKIEEWKRLAAEAEERSVKLHAQLAQL